jgi:hypothetical protein
MFTIGPIIPIFPGGFHNNTQSQIPFQKEGAKNYPKVVIITDGTFVIF